MARAKETCDIIHSEIAKAGLEVSRGEPDKDLNEGRPCQVIPSGKAWGAEVIARDGERIERAFKRYFQRSTEEVRRGGDDMWYRRCTRRGVARTGHEERHTRAMRGARRKATRVTEINTVF